MGGTPLPAGFACYVANAGIKDDTADFLVVAGERSCAAAGVFTRSSFAGPSVIISRRHLEDQAARAIVVVSKNANVATGEAGAADAAELVGAVAERLGCDPTAVLVASTGVIGRRYPMDRLRAAVAAMPAMLADADVDDAAAAIMTTDTVAKVASATVDGSPARIVGIAKGVGMIEPDMATLIALVFTDAGVEPGPLDDVFRRVIDRTFNCVSIDTDTSTSDTAVILTSGRAGPVDATAFEAALGDVVQSLTKQIARDGEGATTLIEVHVDGARSAALAKRVAKAVVNSPLVKTAVHGADPNWGRVAMAVGKATTADEVDQRAVTIRFGDLEVYPHAVDDIALAELTEYMRGTDVRIHVTLGCGDQAATVWGCDLSDGYVRINADYTT